MNWIYPQPKPISALELEIEEMKKKHPIRWWISYNKAKWSMKFWIKMYSLGWKFKYKKIKYHED